MRRWVTTVMLGVGGMLCAGTAGELRIEAGGPGEVALGYASAAGRPWRVQGCGDLTAGWRYEPEVTMGTGAVQGWERPVAAGAGAAFWRVREFPADAPYGVGPGPVAVAPFQDETWYDAGRGYAMPVRIYAPAAGEAGAPYPVVVLSHGLGGSIGAFDGLSGYLASYGFICVMVQHDDTRPDSRVERPLDVTFALDEILGAPTNALLAGRVDASRIAHGGHSFGAFTSLALLGARYHRTNEVSSPVVSFPDGRVRCGVAYSPQGATTLGLFSGSWDGVERPAMTLRGTLDVAPGTTDPVTRDQPYEEMPAGNKYHVVLEGAVHMDFSDTGIAEDGDVYSRWYFPATLAFLRAELNGDGEAAGWLDALALTRLSGGVAGLMSK